MQCKLLVLWNFVVVVGQTCPTPSANSNNTAGELCSSHLSTLLFPKSDAAALLAADFFRHGLIERALSDGQPATSYTGTGWSTSNFHCKTSSSQACTLVSLTRELRRCKVGQDCKLTCMPQKYHGFLLTTSPLCRGAATFHF